LRYNVEKYQKAVVYADENCEKINENQALTGADRSEKKELVRICYA
jgi:hypothetical protein